ncbi:hypothetical protein JW756_02140 [Candidatus Woesearchaeota archaeon]|nr:hypothetical protein [Candidatus Woesearchaeota archaeon]
MKTKLKDIKEMLPETLEYIAMSNEEREADIGNVSAQIKKKQKWDDLDDKEKRKLLGSLQYGMLYSMILSAYRKYNPLGLRKIIKNLKNIEDYKSDSEIDVAYMQKATRGEFMKNMKLFYDAYQHRQEPFDME